jgi:molybdopterin molybdotransferase
LKIGDSFLSYDLSMPVGHDSATILSFEDARRVVEQQSACVRKNGTETVDLLSAVGRVLAEQIVADRDIPPFPRSTRDGYAVRSADLAMLPATLDVIGEIKAGEKPDRIPSAVNHGQAVSIMTGAPVPAGADAVAMVEYTAEHSAARAAPQNNLVESKLVENKLIKNKRVEVTRSVAPGENVVAQGAEGKKDSTLLVPGLRLNQAAIALAASVGKSRLEVFVRPRVAVLTTGDEIVDLAAEPGPTQIRNSNSFSLAAQIQEAGGEPVLLPIAPDEPGKLRQLIEQALQFDLLLLTGGVSMGRYDFVEQALAEIHAEFFFTGAKIQPGRPVVFGRVPAGDAGYKYFFGLPGNPVSTMVTFELFARPMLEALAGMSPRKLAFLHARLKSDVRVRTGLKRFLPAILSGEFENAEVELVAWQGSGDIAATARANCYIVVPPDREHIATGEWVALLAPGMRV